MKNLLKTLDGCLNIVNVTSKYKANNCHITLTDGGHSAIYISSRTHRPSLDAVENICAATSLTPETKFTGISLDGDCGLKNSTKFDAKTLTP
jgi:hypothetical protein